MREMEKNENKYRLPDVLNPFQKKMYLHLIDWKSRHITQDPGYFLNKAYDAIIPDSFMGGFPHIYPPILDILHSHRKVNPFKFHRHFNHVVSSQAAAINLALPLVSSPRANDVFRQLKPDFKEMARDRLDHGMCLEFWGDTKGKGLLGDHTIRYGTDADIAIAYYNKQDQPCLWLIEHKLTEREFTECHAATSKSKRPGTHDCTQSFTDILAKKSLCYYHDALGFRYWEITDPHQDFFVNHHQYETCPFRGGMNQLWRNQLLGFKLEDEKRYHNVYFSVVKHPENTALDKTINDYKNLIDNNEKFSVFTTADVIAAAATLHNTELDRWITWYKDLYKLYQ